MGFLPGGSEWLLILLFIIIFWCKKIPELMRGLGSGIREFKKASNGEDIKDSTSEKKDTE